MLSGIDSSRALKKKASPASSSKKTQLFNGSINSAILSFRGKIIL